MEQTITMQQLMETCKDLSLLYVEDDRMLQEATALLFEGLFKSVTLAQNGTDALKHYTHQPFDIVITDVKMPKMDGIELSKELLTQNPQQHIIIITAYNDTDNLEQILDLNITGYIHKPMSEERLFQVLYKTAQKIHLDQKIASIQEEIHKDETTLFKNRHMFFKDIKTKEGSLIFLSLNNYQSLLNIHGFSEVEEYVNMFASKLKQFCLKSDIYRKSNSKFALIISQEIDAKQLILELEDYFHDTPFDIVFGAALKGSKLTEKANTALDFALQHGLKFSIYNKELNLGIKDQRHEIEVNHIIDEALKNDGVIPYFQPIFDADQNIVKYETLMRLEVTQNNQTTLYYPSQFLSISEKTHRYNELNRTIIKKAFEFIQHTDANFSINLSYHDIIHTDLTKYIEEMIQHSPSVGKQLIIEILESHSIDEPDLLIDFIDRFKKLGVKIAIDDFGAGYSNLNHLLTLECEYLKIDGALIKNITTDKKSAIIIHGIVEIAKALGITTIGEFIANESIYQKAKELGIDEFQGFYLAKPMQKIS
jgi:EAL domain-containing protein (putative c-di-GMP-specific phosphodiesterase class I)/CheY-like chemotaxis protein